MCHFCEVEKVSKRLVLKTNNFPMCGRSLVFESKVMRAQKGVRIGFSIIPLGFSTTQAKVGMMGWSL